MTSCGANVRLLLAVLLLSSSLYAQKLAVNSFPAGANVSVDGVDTGSVTPMNTKINVGVHTVVVFIPNSGWASDIRTVTIQPGQNNLNVDLLPILTVGPQGPIGLTGTTGPQGSVGPQGPAGASFNGTLTGNLNLPRTARDGSAGVITLGAILFSIVQKGAPLSARTQATSTSSAPATPA